MPPNSKHVAEIFKELKKEDYKNINYTTIIDYIKKEPNLCFAKNEERKSLAYCLKKIKKTNPSVQNIKDFESLNKIIEKINPSKTTTKNFINTLRRNSQTTIENIEHFKRRCSIFLLNNTSTGSNKKNTESMNEAHVKYQKQNFNSSFSFGENN